MKWFVICEQQWKPTEENRGFQNLVPVKNIRNFLDRTNDWRTSVSKDKSKKVDTGDDRGENKVVDIRNN